MQVLKKSTFTDDGNGRLTRKGHIEPVTDKNILAKIDEQDEAPAYISSNEDVFTVEEDADDRTKFTIVWVGPGTAQLQVTADADLDPGETTKIGGSEEFKLEEDEATNLKVVLD